MRQTNLFTKTRKEAPRDEISKNAKLLIQAGYISKEMAGVYSFLPLGLRVLENIKDIVRDEMSKIGGQEILMTALQGKEVWEKTDRWDDEKVDDWFKTDLKTGTELGLAFTHEEPLTQVMKNFISSYKNLPCSVYQFQTKFRNELRAKSGILRGREFLMKDLYSFSKNKEEHEEFYEKMKDVYMNIFERLGFGDVTYTTISSGGSFSKYSYEFQTLTEAGEDIVYIIDDVKKIAVNKDDFNDEVLKDFNLENVKKEDLEQRKSIEVGDIYSLGEKYSKALGLSYKDENGEEKFVYMGSYGIGVTRLMGTIVEIFSDENGIVWPETVAPFQIHLLSLGKNEEADKIYEKLIAVGKEVLYDDREVNAGQKFADADLIGIPNRVVVSEKSLKEGGVELKKRNEEVSKIVSIDELSN
ncbi:MAG: aminoacyl--tRNA ligase-related protein [Patescibacteria group bacterium]|nr:aminoacyl--tRNA ligase-related protein [Patescibacteria group bacterium]